MSVKLSPKNFFQTCQDIEAFLFNCQKRSVEKHHPQWVSLSWELPSIDPLIAFDRLRKLECSRLLQNGQQHFYLENPNQNTAIAAVGTASHFCTEGAKRFDLAREFVERCTANAIVPGERDLRDNELRFFCSFTFFDDPGREVAYSVPTRTDIVFPAVTVFLPHWQIARTERQTTAVCNLAIRADSEIEHLARQTWQVLDRLKSLPVSEISDSKPRSRNSFGTRSRPPHPPKRLQPDFRELDRFKQSVVRALDAIATQSLHKIVLSHAIDLVAATPYDLTRSLQNLRCLYPDCYTFATGNGRGQHFIGASPERLLQIQTGELLADALAGSAPRGKTAAADAHLANRLLCDNKELHEHRVVLHFIQQHLQALGLTLRPIPPMRLLQLSNIQHLWTPVRATVPEGVHPLQVLERLHPTPAVAGVPRTLACDAIRQWEAFDRQLYAAPLGWIDSAGNSEFVVGIRSALLDGDRARLYAGAGIVAGSDPEKELAEIQLKLQALLKALA
ncbi:MAG: isochorismate synthase [Cyanobacteria bacterium SID2]|nr:isochorismate synthase [Cyanobacteria bacterium SID2]MBP0005685.1 isochorismate synthase [Cyanobacteria bacterium SBC]